MSVKLIEAKFSKAQDELVLQHSDLSLKSVTDMIDIGSIDISPKYQRRERWSEQEESELIESFIMNIPIPPIYLAEDQYGIYSVIDGKQRLTAIHRFLTNRLKLQKLELFQELEGKFFKDLPLSLANALAIRPYLRVVTLLRQSNSELKHEVFLRLNKAGVPLNSQEIRNVAFRGDLNDMLFDVSENNTLRKMLKFSKASSMYREMTDVQFVLRFFTIKHFWQNFPGNMDKAMDSFMSSHINMGKKIIDEMKDDYLRSLNFCDKVWGEKSFKRLDKSTRVIQGMYDIQMVCPSMLTNAEYDNAINKPNAVTQALVDALNNNDEFLHAVTQFTSNPTNVQYRISAFLNILKSV